MQAAAVIATAVYAAHGRRFKVRADGADMHSIVSVPPRRPLAERKRHRAYCQRVCRYLAT